MAVGLYLDSAPKADLHLAKTTLSTVQVRTRAGRLRTRPAYLMANRGYDSRGFRRVLVRRERLRATYRAFVVLA